MVSEKRRPHQHQTLAIVLVALGVIIFLINTGFVSWFTTLRILQLWPVILMAVGVDIWSKGRYRLMVILAALVVGAGLYVTNGQFRSTAVSNEHIQQSLENASRANVTIATGVSELRIKGLKDSSHLITGNIDLAPGERANQRFNKSATTAMYELRSEWPQSRSLNIRNHLWDLALTTQIPVSLHIEGGVGRTLLELQDIKLTELKVNTGVGETQITLASGNYSAEVNTGVGATTIRLPVHTAARIEVEKGLGAVNVRGDFSINDGVYTSANYATSAEHIDLKVQGGVGAITVEAR
jgi:hypothetical protein